jgi:poly-gamma-glutamate synthesis protein (capsule biosynthesis protein)
MANFALEGPERFFEGKGKLTETKQHQVIAALNPDTQKNPKKQMPTDSYKSLILKCVIDEKKIKSVSYIPVKLDFETNDPVALVSSDPDFHEIADYVEEITRDQNLNTEFVVEGDEVRIII